jgi:hypothetical protein
VHHMHERTCDVDGHPTAPSLPSARHAHPCNPRIHAREPCSRAGEVGPQGESEERRSRDVVCHAPQYAGSAQLCHDVPTRHFSHLLLDLNQFGNGSSVDHRVVELICKGMPHRHVSLRVVARPSVMKQVMNRWEFSCAACATMSVSMRFPSVCPQQQNEGILGQGTVPSRWGRDELPSPSTRIQCAPCVRSLDP